MMRGLRTLSAALVLVGCSSREAEPPTGARFVAQGAAVVRDTRTGLEWTRRADGGGLDWHKASAYGRELAIDGGRGWRLPVIEELRGLYGSSPPVPCGEVTCSIDPAFTLTSQYVWTSSAPQGPAARTYVDFQFGTELTPTINPRLLRRVLCVR